jgi:O-antigen ligase
MRAIAPRPQIQSDRVYRLLCLNAAMVIVGYAVAVANEGNPVASLQVLKYILLLLSIGHLVCKPIWLLRFTYPVTQGAHLLCLLFLLTALLSDHPYHSSLRSLAFLLPFLYVLYAMQYFSYRYAKKDILIALLKLIFFVYSGPVLLFFYTTQDFTATNIYQIASSNQHSLFISNHYGWASVLVLASGADLLKNARLGALVKWITVLLIAVSLYLVFISGSRSALLSLAVIVLILLLRPPFSSFLYTAIALLFTLFLMYKLLQDPKSALQTRFEKTKIQMEHGNSRSKVASALFSHFNENPAYYIHGIGPFNQPRVHRLTGANGVHNSYLDVLFGAGAPAFLLFAFILMVRPGWIYFRNFSSRYLIFPPLVIIPLFESNLTGGQFLFFPWMGLSIFLSYVAPMTPPETQTPVKTK